MSRFMLAFLSMGLCLLTSPALAFTFTGTDPLVISLHNKGVRKVDARFYTAVTGLQAYVVATPELLEQEKLALYIHNETAPRMIALKGHFINAVTDARYDAKSKTLKLVGHINPRMSLRLDYSLETGKTQIKREEY
ncbi:MAG: hypothetical protein ACO1RX_14365 [Candidatus Sericytochromatia bacterium]